MFNTAYCRVTSTVTWVQHYHKDVASITGRREGGRTVLCNRVCTALRYCTRPCYVITAKAVRHQKPRSGIAYHVWVQYSAIADGCIIHRGWFYVLLDFNELIFNAIPNTAILNPKFLHIVVIFQLLYLPIQNILFIFAVFNF